MLKQSRCGSVQLSEFMGKEVLSMSGVARGMLTMFAYVKTISQGLLSIGCERQVTRSSLVILEGVMAPAGRQAADVESVLPAHADGAQTATIWAEPAAHQFISE